jgi:predicted NAD-dependent protein-ADP-ribosyltransferase YbiA (DUF1768 family)
MTLLQIALLNTQQSTERKAKMTTASTASGTSLEPLFFWREFEEPYGFMSQWYDSPFEVDGVTYASTEMWMMIQKAKLFGDEVSLTPSQQQEQRANSLNR